MQSLTNTQKAIIGLIICNIIWGAASPIFKWALLDIQPFTLAFLRFFLAALILFPFVIHTLHIERRDFPKLIAHSVFGITINIAFFFLGLRYTQSINAPIIASIAPIIIILGSWLFLHEKPRLKVVIGTTLALLGIGAIVLQPLIEHGLSSSLLGNAFFVIATLGTVGHALLLKKFIEKYRPLSITFWSFAIGAVSFLPLFLLEIEQYGFVSQLTTPGIVGIVFGALFSSAIAYSLFNWGLKMLPASQVGVFLYIDPVASILVAAPLLGEKPTIAYAVGAVFVFSGIGIAEGRLHYHPFHRLMRKNE